MIIPVFNAINLRDFSSNIYLIADDSISLADQHTDNGLISISQIVINNSNGNNPINFNFGGGFITCPPKSQIFQNLEDEIIVNCFILGNPMLNIILYAKIKPIINQLGQRDGNKKLY